MESSARQRRGKRERRDRPANHRVLRRRFHHETSSWHQAYYRQGRRLSMDASEFEYRHRFWMIVLVYVAAYAFYNLNHLNILYAVVPWNQGVLQKDMLVRLLYAAAA